MKVLQGSGWALALLALLATAGCDDDSPTRQASGGGSGGSSGGSGGGGTGAGGTGGSTPLPLPFECTTGGSTYRVNQDGSADHTTIQDCVDVLGPGDECVVAAGTYLERVDLSGLQGTEAACIAVRGEPGALLDGELSRQSLFYTYDGGHWFLVEGFEIQGSHQDGSIFLGNVHHVILRDNHIHHTSGSAEGIYCSSGCTDVVVQGNEIHDIVGKEGIYFARPQTDSAPSQNLWILDNHLYDVSLEAIDLKNASQVLIAANLVERAGAVSEFALGVSMTTDTHHVEIDGNSFLQMGMGQGRTERGAAIVTGENNGDSHDVLIHHNLIAGGDFAGMFIRGGPGHVVEHNTVVEVLLAGIDTGCFTAGCGQAVVRHNVVVDVGGQEIWTGDGSDGTVLESDYNLAYDGAGGEVLYGHETAEQACTDLGLECHSVVAAPAFVDQAGGDYQPAATSPACGAGQDGSDLGALVCAAAP